MLATTHIAFAILCGLLLLLVFPITDVPVFFTFLVIGSILPDVDHKGSIINKLVPLTRWVPYLFKHRGVFHSLFPVALLSGVFYILRAPTIGIYLCIGYLSHLLSDAMTSLGVGLFYPLSKSRARGWIVVGTIQETAFFTLTIACILFYFFW